MLIPGPLLLKTKAKRSAGCSAYVYRTEVPEPTTPIAPQDQEHMHAAFADVLEQAMIYFKETSCVSEDQSGRCVGGQHGHVATHGCLVVGTDLGPIDHHEPAAENKSL